VTHEPTEMPREHYQRTK